MSDIGGAERWVSVQDAAGIIGKSERTIRRMVSSDKLAHRRDGRRLLVNVSDYVAQEVDVMAEVARLRADVDKLTFQVEQVSSERDYLRGLVAELMLLRQPAIEAPKERQWWQFWRSD